MFKIKSFEKFKKKVTQDNLLSISNIIVILFALTLLSGNFIIAIPSYINLLTIILLLGFLILNLPISKFFHKIKTKNISSKKFLFSIILIIFSLFLLLFSYSDLLWIMSIPIIVSSVDFALGLINIERKELKILSIGSLIFSIFYILIHAIPSLLYIFSKFSLSVTSFIGKLIGKPTLFGPSISGFWMVVIFLIFSFTIFYFDKNRKKIMLLLNIITIFAIWIIYILIMILSNFYKLDAINLYYILFIGLLIPTLIYFIFTRFMIVKIDSFDLNNFKLKKIVKSFELWSILFMLISMVVLTTFIETNDYKKNNDKTVLFYGQDFLGDWRVPDYGEYSREAASGMYGVLPYYLERSGYNIKIVVDNITEFNNNNFPLTKQAYADENFTEDNNSTEMINVTIIRNINFSSYTDIIESDSITEEILKEVDIFVVISIKNNFSPQEHKTIWKFIENGGSLLVLGDHTDIGGMKDPLNDLLAPIGISYKFDSGLPIEQNFDWEPCYGLMYHPISYNTEILDEIQIGVGATLEISNLQSFPIIFGKYGLSDRGDYLKNSYLGDYNYTSGEQLGDVVLVAGSYYGNGKVIVFGDTSSFQNLALTNSISFVKNVINWLAFSSNGLVKLTQIILFLMFFLFSIIFYIFLSKQKILFLIFPVIICFAIIFAIIINSILIIIPPTKGNIAYIDTSHNEFFNKRTLNLNSLDGIYINVMRNDYLPILLRDFSEEEIKNSELLILSSPTEIINDKEIKILKEYMYDGGYVILAAGFNERSSYINFINEFGLDVYDFPLGPVPYTQDNPEEFIDQPRFADSWVIKLENAVDTESFYNITIEGYKYDLVTFTKYGSGGLLFICDSQFLYNKNIESIDELWPGNIQFLKNIFDFINLRDEGSS
jgi:hypothetical protein